ncbi:MAG: hypothetical protein JWN78_3014 [Bacteroidota bacterium]|nr:hypothetical protein [Bacteroidota bacterium]
MKKNLLTLLLILFVTASPSIAAVNLIITGGTVPNSMYAGQSYPVTINVKNSGSTLTTKDFIINLSINNSNTYNGGQTWIKDIQVIGGIPANTTRSYSTTIVIGSSTPPGVKYILAGADALNAVSESSESDNNFAFSTLIQTLPDLTPISYSMSLGPYTAGNGLTASFAVKNTGSASTGSFSAGFYLSPSSTLIVSQSTFLGSYQVSGVSGNSQTGMMYKDLSIPSTICSGTYYLFIWVDNGLSISESADNNNFQSLSLYINNFVSNSTPSTISPGNTSSSNPTNATTGVMNWNTVNWANTYNIYVRDLTTNQLYNYNCASSTTTYTLPSSILISGHNYKWNMTASSSCGQCNSLISNDRYFIFNSCTPVTSVALPVPSALSVCVGGTASFTVTQPNATPPFSYQWRKGTTLLSNGTKYQGVNSTTLSITGITSSDAGSYNCEVTGCNNSTANSSSSQLSVTTSGTNPNASFVSSSNDINVGESVIFSPVNPCNGCSYQWSFSGGTPASSSQPIKTVTYNTAGSYRVTLTITNACGLSATKNIPGFITVNANANHTNNAVTPPNTIVNMDGYKIAFACDPVKIPTLDYGYNNAVLNMNSVAGLIEFKVYYNSNTPTYNSNLGTGWSHNFDYHIQNEGDTIWRMYYAEGYNVPFIKLHDDGSKSFPLYAGIFETLTKDTIANTYAFTFKNGTVYNFNSIGKLDNIHDRYNNITDIEYAANGDLIKITAPGERYWTFTNQNGKITSIKDLANRSVQLNYTGSDITGIVDPDLGATIFQYDGSHLMTDVANPEGNLLLHNVYLNGKVTSQSDALGNTTNFFPNTPSNNFTTVRFSNGTSKIYQSDDFYRILDEEDEEGYHIKHGYYIDNTDSFLIDKNNNLTTFDKDSVGNIIAIHRPLNINETFEYDKFSLLTKETDGEGYVTSHRRDRDGNEIQTVLPDLTRIRRSFDNNTGQLQTEINEVYTTSYTYNSQGDVTHVETPTGGIDIFTTPIGWDTASINQIGQKTLKSYNGRGLVKRFVDIDNIPIVTEYDKNGNKTSITDKRGFTTQIKYDLKDRQFATCSANGDTLERKYFDDRDFIVAIKGANKAITRYDNDKRGLPKMIINPLSGTTQIECDGNGNIKTSTDDLHGISTTNVWDKLNRNISVTSGSLTTTKHYLNNSWVDIVTNTRNLPTKFSYTPIGKVSDILDPNNIPTHIEYDQLGNPTKVTDPNQHQTKTVYDDANRPYKYLDAFSNGDELTLDNIGRILKIEKGNGVTISTSFTAANLPETVTYSGYGDLNFSYDENGNTKTATGPSGISKFEYDTLNHVKKYIDPFSNEINYNLDPAGNLTWMQYQQGKELNINYNGLNEILNVKDWRGGNYTYTYDATGRLSTVAYPNGMHCDYRYDNNGLITSKIWKKNNTVLYADTASRAAWGDIQSIACGKCYPKITQTKSYGASYDNANQVIRDSIGKHFFDKAGNDTLIQGDSSSMRMRYSANNILTSYSTTNSQVSYGYDAFFNRIKRTENGVEKRYVINAGTGLTNVLMEQNSSGGINTYNIYGAGLLARIDSGKIVYYITDIKHNVVALADDTAGITDRYIYTLHGKIWKHTGTSKQPYTWLGEYGVQRENDSLFFVRARYFDGMRGRFINRDPYDYDLNNPQTINRYVYALNNAVNLFDWSGLCGDNDNSSISAPNKNLLYKGSNVIYNFILGAGHGLVEGFNLNVFNPGRTEYIESTYNPSYSYGYKTGGVFGSLAFIGSFFTGEGEVAMGGRLGNLSTRTQVGNIATEMESQGYQITGGGSRLPEEYLRPLGGGRKGGSYPDITAIKDGQTIRINTVDTYKNGQPTLRELNNAERIRNQTPGDKLLLIPKIK